ncbi:hypothetical protein PT974_11786 [Cladobotryum mycophilum]|uniref:Zn(2)-C6 fungal-type domain-containing protein n=1 Tax=Cladobotryum mycophilum TaxID=491253 RepID=A0ABR0S654_9HYPO
MKDNPPLEGSMPKVGAEPASDCHNSHQNQENTAVVGAAAPSNLVPAKRTALAKHAPRDVHVGWDVSGISTAKCDLCHKQRCGAIQKCRECKLSVCRTCCLSGRLNSDEKHILDAETVSWITPPVTRKRRAKVLKGSIEKPAIKTRVSDKTAGQGQTRRLTTTDNLRDGTPPTDIGSRLTASIVTPIREYHHPHQTPDTIRGHGPVEPRFSVAPTSPYHPRARARHLDIYRSPHTYEYGSSITTGSPIKRSTPLGHQLFAEDESNRDHTTYSRTPSCTIKVFHVA